MTAKQIDLLNIGLMLVSIVLAVMIPFHLFLLSYAVLGPLHYLTEIGWLDDKNYFANKKRDVWILVGLCAFVTLAFSLGQMGNYEFSKNWMKALESRGLKPAVAFVAKWEKSAIFVAFISGLALAFIKKPLYKYGLIVLAMVGAYFLHDLKAYILWIGIMLPTVIHVYVFTGLFILYGALKSKSVTGFASFMVFLLILFYIVFNRPDVKAHHLDGYWLESMKASNFHLINASIARFFGWSTGQFMVFSKIGIKMQIFLAFAYTYHYLNWFSKTKIINWHKVSKPRLYGAIAIWIGSIALYIYNYKVGLAALFFLSVLHVFLEFPLNFKSFVGIYTEVKQRILPNK